MTPKNTRDRYKMKKIAPFDQSALQRNAHVVRIFQWRVFFRCGGATRLYDMTTTGTAPPLLGGHYCIFMYPKLRQPHSTQV